MINVLKSKYDNEYLDRTYVMALCDIYNGFQSLQYGTENLTESQLNLIKKIVKGQARYSYADNDNRSYFEETFQSLIQNILESEANVETNQKITEIKTIANL